jgi:thiopeptide-type bacteriocin biosynthesis protein
MTEPALTDAVEAVLAGVAPADAARVSGVAEIEIGPAVERFLAAGRAVLAREADPWWYVRIDTTDVRTMVLAVERALADAPATWWFLRKHDGVEHVRLRVRPRSEADGLAPLLADLGATTELVYEPEVALFGGPEGMEASHDLFHADSSMLARWWARHTDDEGDLRTVSLAVIDRMVLLAGLDGYERWDLWQRVATLRPWPEGMLRPAVERNRDAAGRLLAQDWSTLADRLGEPVADEWVATLARPARQLAALDRAGALGRGLRSVLATHVTFHWNRLGFSAAVQAGLARLASEATAPQADASGSSR